MKIFAWAAERAACYYYRLALPLGELRKRGHDVRIAERRGSAIEQVAGSTALAEEIREWHRDVDVLIGQRVYLPGPTGYWQRAAKTRGRPLMVYEVDDNLLEVDGSSPSHQFFADPQIRANIVDNIRVADLVTVSTEPLAEVCRRHNPNVVVLPNCVPDELVALRRPAPGGDPVTLGWQGSSTHAMDWAELHNPLRQFLRRNPRVHLTTIGAPEAMTLRLGPDQWTHREWLDDLWSYYGALDFDIGLAPLRPHPFNQSKSNLRVLEYAARGIPVVASAVTPYERFVRHGETGFLVRREHEWGRHLATLLDEQTRTDMSQAARKQAAEWVISRNAHLWEDAYLAALGTMRPAVAGVAA